MNEVPTNPSHLPYHKCLQSTSGTSTDHFSSRISNYCGYTCVVGRLRRDEYCRVAYSVLPAVIREIYLFLPPQRSCKSFIQPVHQALILERPPKGGSKKKAEGSEASTPVCPLAFIPYVELQLIGDASQRPSSSSSRTFMSPNHSRTRIIRRTRTEEPKT